MRRREDEVEVWRRREAETEVEVKYEEKYKEEIWTDEVEDV